MPRLKLPRGSLIAALFVVSACKVEPWELPVQEVYGLPNIDDDDTSEAPDWEEELVDDNDRASWSIPAAVFEDAKKKDTFRLTLAIDEESGIRVWSEGEVVLDAETTEMAITAEGPLEFEVEFADYLDSGALTLEHSDKDGELRQEATVSLQAAPLILSHHLQAGTEVMSVRVPGGSGWGNYANLNMQEDYQSALGERFVPISGQPYGYDVWVQDEFEFASLSSPDHYVEVFVDSIRNGQGARGGGIDDWAEDNYQAPDFAVITPGSGRATSYDYFGNLEVSPPVTVDGTEYPYGRVYWGSNPANVEFLAFLEDQRVQKPFKVDSSWLCVGHVDEFTTTIPDPSAEKGFRLALTDTEAAWDLLEDMDPATELPQYAQGGWDGHSIDTVGEMLEDAALRALNEDIQLTIDAQKATFMAELGLSESDILYIPGLFEEPQGCGTAVAALIPGMANLIVADEPSGQTTLVLADPFLRSDLDDQSTDPVIQHVRDSLPDGLEAVFLDDWYVYHMGLGEVHCGSNVVREMDTPWWDEAKHLLEDGE